MKSLSVITLEMSKPLERGKEGEGDVLTSVDDKDLVLIGLHDLEKGWMHTDSEQGLLVQIVFRL